MESGMISVDKWSSGSQAYFLTHLHADHTAGLSYTWKRGPLFCSRLTAKLFPCKFPGFDLSLLRILDIGCWHSLSLTTPSTGSATTVFVKAIDAHHCPGSVMYLFRGEFGCMLFTGDFRWETTGNGVESGRAMLLDALKNETLDTLYLDNTYCNPRYSFPSREGAAKQVCGSVFLNFLYCNPRYAFPSREGAAKQVVDIITSHPAHEVIIGIDSVGKEDLLLYISRTLNIKIWVWPERLQIMHLLGFHENFTTQTSLTRVRAVPRYSFSIETLEGLNTLRPTIGVMPSGLPWAIKAVKGNRNLFGSCPSASCLKKENSSKDSTSCSKTRNLEGDSARAKRYHEYIYVVPYSDHSCFSEIQEFIELLRPVKIKGIVASSSCYIDPSYYFDHLCGTKQAFWRINRKLENDEEVCAVEAAETKPAAEVTSTATRRKRRIDQVDVFGIRVSRVSLLRRLGCGVKIADSEYYS